MRRARFVIVYSSLLLVSSHAVWAMGSKPDTDTEGANSRILPVAQLTLAHLTTAAGKERSGEDLYKAACSACHDSGAAGAPKLGDKVAWAPRIKRGLNGLVKSATNGKDAMPPKGGSDANEKELTRAVIFMANQSGASFK